MTEAKDGDDDNGFVERRKGEVGGPRKPSPGSSKWKLWFWKADWAWRRIVPLIALALAAFAVASLQNKVDRQSEGRRIAIEVLCGGILGVQEAGKRILTGTLPPPAPKSPRTSEQETESRRLYSISYSRVISARVLEQASIKGERVLNEDGTINCERLKIAASAVTSGDTLRKQKP
jgi:hypothetical protein